MPNADASADQDRADARLLRMLAAVHLRFGRLDRAQAFLGLAQHVAPDDTAVATLRAVLALRTGDADRALDLLPDEARCGDDPKGAPARAVLRLRIEALRRAASRGP